MGERRLPHDRDADPDRSELLIEALDLHAGERVLDVATGSGNAALAAARRGCTVIGIDYVPALLERARRRADGRGPVARSSSRATRRRCRSTTPASTSSASVFGAMFAPDQERTARELARVCRPGGRIGLVAHTPDGFIGKLFKVDRAPRPAAGGPPLADPVGHRGAPPRAVRRTDRRDARRRSGTSSCAIRRRRRTSSTGGATTVRRSRRSRRSARPAGTGSRQTCSTSSPASTAPTTARWSSRASTSKRSSSSGSRRAVDGAPGPLSGAGRAHPLGRRRHPQPR